jgi:hypothetical protein
LGGEKESAWRYNPARWNIAQAFTFFEYTYARGGAAYYYTDHKSLGFVNLVRDRLRFNSEYLPFYWLPAEAMPTGIFLMLDVKFYLKCFIFIWLVIYYRSSLFGLQVSLKFPQTHSLFDVDYLRFIYQSYSMVWHKWKIYFKTKKWY